MKLLKRITAVIAALLIVVNITVVHTFALAAAPVAGEEVAETLITMLIAAGHSQSELDGMSVTELQSLADMELKGGNLNSGTVVYDPVTQQDMPLINWLFLYGRPDMLVVQGVHNFVADWQLGWNSAFGSYEYIIPTSTTDLMGGGAKAVITYANGNQRAFTCEYIIVDTSRGVDSTIITLRSTDGECYQYDLQKDGTYKLTWQSGGSANLGISGSGTTISDFGISDRSGNIYNLYGDVRTIDGEAFPTDDEYKYQLGEIDGTAITPDMLNPDGTVTIDGVTYDPADYLDPDKLTEEGQNALIGAIVGAISNTYVKAEDEPLVDVDDITVEIAEEFQDYAVPVGIANVFPFCIPWDIVRGFQLLNRPAIVPRFEIPFNIPEFGFFPGVEKSIILDFSKYDTYIQIFRWFQVIGFSFLLCKLSMTHVKGAGA